MCECSDLYDVERQPWSSEKSSEYMYYKTEHTGHRAINILYGINMWYETIRYNIVVGVVGVVVVVVVVVVECSRRR